MENGLMSKFMEHYETDPNWTKEPRQDLFVEAQATFKPKMSSCFIGHFLKNPIDFYHLH